MTEYKAEIIAVGTELLLGQIANTNAQWLSNQLADRGIDIYNHHVVGDNLDRVKSTFELAGSRSDIVLVTGGLGPTEDDLTREAFQSLTNKDLIEDKEAMNKISSYFVRNNRTMTPNNKKQALVFGDSLVLQNSTGMAPGMIVEHNRTIWIFMPGVPREMKSITEEHVIPYLEKNLNLEMVIQSRMLHFIGIGESTLEYRLKSLINEQQNPTIAPLASDGEVSIRITAKAQTKQVANVLIDEMEKKVLKEVDTYFYGHDDTTIKDRVFELLKEKGQTIGVAESLTGGKFSDEFVSIKGASAVFKGGFVSYSVDSKREILGVRSEVIDHYGTVSEPCAKEMAENAKQKLNATFGISFTGVAGPTESEGKKVGTVFISIFSSSSTKITKEFHFEGNREGIRNRAVKKGFELLYHLLKK